MKYTLALLVALALPLAAGDAWKTKKLAELSPDEVHDFLTKSPWAKEVTASMTLAGMPGGAGGGGGGGRRGGGPPATSGEWGAAPPSTSGLSQGVGGGSGRGGMRGGGGDMGSSSAPPVVKFQVRWMAPHVREALTLAKAPTVRPELLDQYYVVTVMRIGGQQRPGGGRGEGAQGGPPPSEEYMARLKQVTALKLKGKEPLQPAGMAFATSEEGRITLFFFPRKDTIGPDDKEAEFQTYLGPLEIKSKFDLKKMVWNGSPAL